MADKGGRGGAGGGLDPPFWADIICEQPLIKIVVVVFLVIFTNLGYFWFVVGYSNLVSYIYRLPIQKNRNIFRKSLKERRNCNAGFKAGP